MAKFALLEPKQTAMASLKRQRRTNGSVQNGTRNSLKSAANADSKPGSNYTCGHNMAMGGASPNKSLRFR